MLFDVDKGVAINPSIVLTGTDIAEDCSLAPKLLRADTR
jgi:hypothetical protein